MALGVVVHVVSWMLPSAVEPGHIVLTFQLAKRRAGVFFVIGIRGPGAGMYGLLFEMVLYLHAPNGAGKPRAGKHLIGWRLPSLRRR